MFARPSRSLLDFTAAALCVWAAVYHTPVGALGRSVVARMVGATSKGPSLLAYYTGGVYDAHEVSAPEAISAVPDASLLAAMPPGRALGRGAYVSAARLTGDDRAPVDALARRYGLSFANPEDAARVLEQAQVELGGEEAAVLALFAGYDVARYALARAKAEGRAPTLEVLAAQLPPSAIPAVTRASQALMVGTAYGLSWPVAPGTRVSSPFGWRTHPILGRGQFHTGVDLSVPEGTPVKVVADGVVRRASEDAVNGRVVVVDHGRGVSTAYCHNARLRVVNGMRVKAGDVIAESGNTGRSTGPHLHYQLELGHKPIDPFAFRGSKPLLLEPPGPPSPSTRAQEQLPSRPVKSDLRKAFDQFGAPEATEL
jgi:murein DD-endopeptidase MepM/ murein hydrolase activator NlpD